MISLEDFVAETLIQIINGVEKAQAEAAKRGAEICPVHYKSPRQKIELSGAYLIQQVNFDVAITATDGRQTKGGIGVFLGGIGAGSQGQSEVINNTLNRISFTIPVSLPKQDSQRF